MPDSTITTQLENRISVGNGTRAAKETQRASLSEKPEPVKDPERAGDREPPTQERVSDTVDHLNELMQQSRRELHFSVDDNSGRTVIKVIDSATQELVRQIPPEQLLSLMHNFENDSSSLLLDVEA
jgi:flagellar protein FlaG